MLRTAIKVALVVIALGFLAHRAWGVGAADVLWQPGGTWTVAIERMQVFVPEPSPPWAEVNRVRFEVLRVTQGEGGTRIQVRVTFDRPVLNGYKVLDLTYDGDTLAPLSGRLTGEGRPEVDWKTARPLLEASLIPLQGLSWREVTADRLAYHTAGQQWDAYRVQQDGREYAWADDLPWWLWYKAGEQVRAELVDCSCWSGKSKR